MALKLESLALKHRHFLLMMHNPDGPNPDEAARQFAIFFGEAIRPETVRSYWIQEGRSMNSSKRNAERGDYESLREQAMEYLSRF